MKEVYSKAEYNAVLSAQKPEIKWKAEAGYLNGKPSSPYSLISGSTEENKKIVDSSGYYYTTGIGVDFPLYRKGAWIGSESPLLKEARFGVIGSKYQYITKENEVRHRVTELYYTSLKIMEEIYLHELRNKTFEKEYKALEAKLQLGLIPQNDLLALESMWVSENHSLFNAKQLLSASKKELALILGISMNEDIVIVTPETPLPDRPPVEDVLSVVPDNPTIKTLESYVKQVESELDLVRKEKKPVLDFNLSYSLGDDFSPPLHSFWTSSLSTRVNIFDFGMRKSREDVVQAKLHEAQLKLLQIKNETLLKVDLIYQKIIGVEDRIAYLEKDIAVSRQSLTLAQEKVKEHISPESIVYEAEVLLAEKQMLLNQAKYDWRIAFSELWKEAGGNGVFAGNME